MKYDVYDFDGTIYDGDSGIDLVLFALKKKPGHFFRVFWAVIKYALRLISKVEFKGIVFSFLKGIEDVDAFVDEFWQGHEKKLKSFWLEKESHSNDIIISASGTFWLNWIKEKYEVGGLIATDIDVRTGEVVGDNCFGAEKVRLFYLNFPKGQIGKMYTDSINDLPLIKEAEEGILVKGDKLFDFYSYKPNFLVRFWRFGWSIYHKNEEIWNYLIVGGLTTFVSLAVKWGLLFTILDAKKSVELQASVVISWIAAVAFAYVANRIYVFKSENKDYLKEISSFVGARLVTLFMEMFIMWFFVTFLKLNTDVFVLIITVVTQFLIVIFNYLFSKLLVFRKKVG